MLRKIIDFFTVPSAESPPVKPRAKIGDLFFMPMLTRSDGLGCHVVDRLGRPIASFYVEPHEPLASADARAGMLADLMNEAWIAEQREAAHAQSHALGPQF